ncbi:MAG: hypothetical protein MUF83_12530 [Acidimicrobiales bacterium]|nr:hypothetical protein [Acidimicrobiales bacterium]
MSDVAKGPGWWQASDGRWYPPRESDEPPAPDWWLASDGRWYPPREADGPPASDWWLAADGKWYPPASEEDALDLTDGGPTTATSPAGPTGVDPGDWLLRRDEQSRRDAALLAGARASAALRALRAHEWELEAARDDPARPPADVQPPGTFEAAMAAAALPPAQPDLDLDAVPDHGPTSGETTEPGDAAEPPPQPAESERLVIFADRLELHARSGVVRERIAFAEVADVATELGPLGATVTVRAVDGTRIVAKGLVREQAEQVCDLISTRVACTPRRETAPPSTPRYGREPIDELALVAKLLDLHRAGVLTDEELLEKRELVARLANGELAGAS